MSGQAIMLGNAYSADCPTRLVLDRIGDKWAVLILILLARRSERFSSLRRQIEGISQKMLSQTLKSLERDGLVSRKAFATVPVTVEYSITPLGETLAATVDQVRLWADRYIGEVQAAQRVYDAGAGAGAVLPFSRKREKGHELSNPEIGRPDLRIGRDLG